MSAKRFENRLNKDKKYFNALNPVWDNWQGTALSVFEMIDVMNEQSDELVEYCNFSLHDLLDKKNKEIEQLKKAEILANHRGEMISFADSLIDDLGSETMKEMWDKFKNEKYEKWCELE